MGSIQGFLKKTWMVWTTAILLIVGIITIILGSISMAWPAIITGFVIAAFAAAAIFIREIGVGGIVPSVLIFAAVVALIHIRMSGWRFSIFLFWLVGGLFLVAISKIVNKKYAVGIILSVAATLILAGTGIVPYWLARIYSKPKPSQQQGEQKKGGQDQLQPVVEEKLEKILDRLEHLGSAPESSDSNLAAILNELKADRELKNRLSMAVENLVQQQEAAKAAEMPENEWEARWRDSPETKRLKEILKNIR